MIRYYRGRLEFASKMQDPEEAQVEREDARRQLERAEKANPQLEQFLADIKNDWEDPKKRIVGHVILSPPLSFSALVRTTSLKILLSSRSIPPQSMPAILLETLLTLALRCSATTS